MTKRRVVVTGIGAVSPLGLTAQELWQQICLQKSGIDKIKAFDPAGFTCRIAGEVPEFNIQKFTPKAHRKAVKLMSRDIKLAVIAANEAFENAGLVTIATDPENPTIDPKRTAINLGAGLISCDLEELAPAIAKSVTDGKFDLKKWGSDGLQLVTPLWLLKYLPNMLACHIGIIHDIQGPSNTITCAEASAHLAIAEAAQIIARNSANIALAGGGEAKVNPIIMMRQCLLKRATSEYNDDPQNACRPFDAGAKGSVFGEAAATVILEELQNAKNRNANIYAELVGIGQSNNINTQYEKLEPGAKGLEIAIKKALEDAQIKPEDIDLIIPHGTGIPDDDKAEAIAIMNALDGKTDIPVLPTKSMVSNTGAAAGAIDFIIAAKAIKENYIPAAKNFKNPAEGINLNIVTEPIKKEIKYALCCSYTYGGQTAALILKKFDQSFEN